MIKSNEHCKLIVSVANASLLNLRSHCRIFHVSLASLHPSTDQATNTEEEVILYTDFYTDVIAELGLKKLTDLPEEKAKLDDFLT